MDLAHLSTNPLCSLPLTQFTISPSTSSVWIYIVLPLRSWPIPQHPHHPHQTPSLRPGITNVVANQIQVCQGRVVLQSFCQSLTADKDLQNTSWNHLRFFEIHIQEISTPSTACSHTSAHTDISCQCGLQWNEKNKLKFTQICIMDLAHLSTNPLCSLPFTHFTISPSIGSVWIHIFLPPLVTDSSASSPSSPNTKPEPRYHQCCSSPNSGLSGSSCASVLLPMPDSKQRSANYVVKLLCKIQIQEISRRVTTFFSTFLWYSHVVSNETNKHKFNQICMMDLAHLSTNPLYGLSFHSVHHSTVD